MRTRLVLAVGALTVVAAAAVPALASDNDDPPSQIPQHAQCGHAAGSGAFGAFGQDNNVAGGADGYQTGLNNSALCGNRPGN